MATHALECHTDFLSFMALRTDWELFTDRYFPENYARTHGWLSAWWKTYHNNRSALVYIQRDVSDGRIVAVAPLFVCRENFGGFPTRLVVSLGRGIGTDDFLVSEDSSGFLEQVIGDLVGKCRWDIAIFRRIGTITSLDALTIALDKSQCSLESVTSYDYLINLPENFEAYFKEFSKNFRQNLRTASNRMNKAGTVSTKILDPSRESSSVISVGMSIATTSWQYKEGKSHFNENTSGSFYHNLASQNLVEGLEFNVLYLNETPVSYLLGYQRGEKYYVIDIAFHSAFKFYSAGNVLYIKVIERLIAEKNVTQIDLEGAGEYKDDYANARRMTYSVTIFNNNIYAKFIRTVRKSVLYESLKNKLKKQ